MQAPTSFVRCLEAMDSLLAVRFGPHVHSWVIERKAVLPKDELFYLRRRAERLSRKVNAGKATRAESDTLKGVLEEMASAETGRRVIFFTPRLDESVYNKLCMGDIKRYGGYSRYCDEIDRKEAFADEDRERQMSNERITRNKEMAKVINFLDDHRSTALAHGNRNVAQMLGTKDYLPRTLPKHLFDGNGRVAANL